MLFFIISWAVLWALIIDDYIKLIIIISTSNVLFNHVSNNSFIDLIRSTHLIFILDFNCIIVVINLSEFIIMQKLV